MSAVSKFENVLRERADGTSPGLQRLQDNNSQEGKKKATRETPFLEKAFWAAANRTHLRAFRHASFSRKAASCF